MFSSFCGFLCSSSRTPTLCMLVLQALFTFLQSFFLLFLRLSTFNCPVLEFTDSIFCWLTSVFELLYWVFHFSNRIFFLPPRFLFWFLFMFSTTLLIFSLCSQHHFPIFLHVFYGFLSILRLLFKSLSSMSATQVSSRMFSPLMGHTFLFLYALWYFVEEMFESYNLTPEIIFPSFPRICCLLVF